MLTGEYRFMTRRTYNTANVDYMPDDRETGEERYRYQVGHEGNITARWRTSLQVDRVSDDRYFQDYGTSLRQTARQFLRSSAMLTGVGRYWNFEFMADDFQVIDENVTPENEPYQRFPRIAFWMDRPLGGTNLTFGLDSELVYFDRDVGVTGARVDLYPNTYWDKYNRWGFLKPRVGYRYRAYELDYQGLPNDESPDAGNAIVSLDTGLIFDRFTSDGGYQPLEPRLFYLYVPFDFETVPHEFSIFETTSDDAYNNTTIEIFFTIQRVLIDPT